MDLVGLRMSTKQRKCMMTVLGCDAHPGTLVQTGKARWIFPSGSFHLPSSQVRRV